MNKVPQDTSVFIGIDPIGGVITKQDKVKKSSSFFVAFVLGVDAYGTRMVLNIIRKKGLTFQGQKDEIKALKAYDPVMIAIEDNAAQRWLVSDLIDITDLPVKGFTTSTNKYSLEHGVPSLALEFENGKWVLPYNNPRTRAMMDLMIEEFASWPIGSTTDIVMAAWMAKQAVDECSGNSRVKQNVEQMVELIKQQKDAKMNIYDIVKNGRHDLL